MPVNSCGTAPAAPTAPSEDGPLVLHVIPTRRARGGQLEARALADRLDRPGVRAHRVLSLFAGPVEVRADVAIDHPGGRRPAVGFDPRLAMKLRTTLDRLDPAAVVAHGGEPLKYLVPSMVRRRVPLAYYAIGTFAGSGHRAQLVLWRFLSARADVVAAEGAEVAEECVERLRVEPSRVVVVPNGRDPAVFHPPGEHAGPPTVLFVGALTTGKRPHWFVDLVADLREKGFAGRAVMLGDGPERSRLESPARSAGVEILGSRSDVAERLRAADVLVFPSAGAGEGTPGVLIEAGLSGLPVVATDVPGVRTILIHDETGIIVGVDDRSAMTAAVAQLLDRPGLRATMGAAARARCERLFGIDRVTEAWSGLLAPLLARARGGPGAGHRRSSAPS